MNYERLINMTFETRLEKLQIADSLVGQQVWVTHWWTTPFKWEKLKHPQIKKVKYVSLLPNGNIQLHFQEGALLLEEYGHFLFDTKEAAEVRLHMED